MQIREINQIVMDVVKHRVIREDNKFEYDLPSEQVEMLLRQIHARDAEIKRLRERASDAGWDAENARLAAEQNVNRWR